jgi:hypothetical protein
VFAQLVAVVAAAASSPLAQPARQGLVQQRQQELAGKGSDFLRRARGGYATSDVSATPVLVPLMKSASVRCSTGC